MFSNINLIAVGDSFVYGEIDGDYNVENCHARSFIGKLKGFKSVVNLSAPGGSNQRSKRVLLDYLEKNYLVGDEYLVLFFLTDASRSELVASKQIAVKDNLYTRNDGTEKINDKFIISNLGTWVTEVYKSDEIQQYVSNYYKHFYHHDYALKILSYDLVCLTDFLNQLNIKILFGSSIMEMDDFKKLNYFNRLLPSIKLIAPPYSNTSIQYFLRNRGFIPVDGSHYDHNANEFLAAYIENFLKEMLSVNTSTGRHNHGSI